MSAVVGAVVANVVANFFLSIFQAATALFFRKVDLAAFHVFLGVELFFVLFIVVVGVALHALRHKIFSSKLSS